MYDVQKIMSTIDNIVSSQNLIVKDIIEVHKVDIARDVCLEIMTESYVNEIDFNLSDLSDEIIVPILLAKISKLIREKHAENFYYSSRETDTHFPNDIIANNEIYERALRFIYHGYSTSESKIYQLWLKGISMLYISKRLSMCPVEIKSIISKINRDLKDTFLDRSRFIANVS